MHYSIHWKLFKRYKNIIQVQVTFLDNEGKCQDILKYYEEWIGVCTNNIQSVVNKIKKHFPGHNILYQEMSQVKKVLPYFEDRLKQNKLNYRSKPFYKVYTTASHLNIGQLLNCHKITYFDPDDWLVRIYIDLCTKYKTHSFYYAWYDIENDSKDLMSAFKMIPDCRIEPNWTVAAFDIEAVPLKGNHIPMGYHETDRVVMFSVCKWNNQKQENYLLYLIPEGCEPLPETKMEEKNYPKILHFYTEKDMFIQFHDLLKDAQILTGYNINAFDLPCIFARLTWLDMKSFLKGYKSVRVGSDVIVTYEDKIVIDLYTFFKTFSGYDLPSFKLDDVARVKLGETKLQVKSTGIWSWYRRPASLIKEWIREEKNVEKCFNALKPDTVSKPEEFGTFRKYLDYCLKDSELVFKLFKKEHVLSFLVERANLTALDAVQVLHLGNSRYLLELFKTYGNRLGYFINSNSFLNSPSLKYDKFFFQGDKTYQGALNFCIPEQTYQDVSIMDFASMYPSSLVSSNLCYGTCTLMTRDEWCKNEAAQRMTTIPYRHHSDYDFLQETTSEKTFSYPAFNSKTDEFAIVINTQSEAFLPEVVKHFIKMRKFHQKEWKKTENIYHYNVQLGIKILINSLYGVMANKDSPLAYLPIAMTIVTLSRYQLLGSYHYIKNLGYNVCYADTDSLMVHRWPEENCDRINFFLNLPHVELKYEQRLKYLLVLSKKRYIYQRFDGSTQPVTKGFQKKINGIVSFMTQKILKNVWYATFQNPIKATPSNGWIVWVEAILEANYRCRDPKKYSIYRKVKNLNEYKSSSCPSVKYLKKYPDKVQEHIEFTYSRADVSVKEVSNWIMDVQDVKWVHFEQLFITQKKIFCLLLNMTFWHLSNPTFMADMVLNTLHWKKFVHAELLHWHATGKKLALLFEPKIKYTFCINDHLTCSRRRGHKRKIKTDNKV